MDEAAGWLPDVRSWQVRSFKKQSTPKLCKAQAKSIYVGVHRTCTGKEHHRRNWQQGTAHQASMSSASPKRDKGVEKRT